MNPKLRFEPLKLELEPRPEWWRVRPEEIMELCRSVKRGRAEVIAETPAGFPVYAVFYGDFSEPAPRTNWSAAGSSSTYRSYYTREGAPQTFLFLAGIHGAEAESVCAAVNLIQLLETGRDFRGRRDEELLRLIEAYRLIVIPCANMDGRAISPDHLRHADDRTFRGASQGFWKNGKVIEWRESKQYFPLPLDEVAFPGGYPNSEGFNINHDAAPGHIRTAEARAILRLCERWQVDAVLNGHSCEYGPALVRPSVLMYPAHQRRILSLTDRAAQRFYQAGLLPEPPPPAPGPAAPLNLDCMMTFASGALAVTLECSVGSTHDRYPFGSTYTFEQLAEPPFILLKLMLADGLEAPFSDRAAILR